ncbi:MAG TPA: S-adenosyl-l-methionine hydroxide adenosyltransferase family protein [Woeseiaceae bacterium]|nr:S-adenosyl-l-methionine hydroxide adenosyltransferase family protein [Woeseiaceae bacterium]
MRQLSIAVIGLLFSLAAHAGGVLVLQSDFGEKDGAVAAMRGVAVGVESDLSIHDLTHEIPVFNIWEAALRLEQTAKYWPPGTVFVSVVDPGVGTERKSVVLKTRSGHYFVTPDNGTLTFVAETLGIEAVREIDEAVNRLRNSEESYTFHGRDVYAYTGARLAAGEIGFEGVGRLLEPRVVSIPHQQAELDDGVIRGNIPILDVRYGNVWTNIGRDLLRRLGAAHGDGLAVAIRRGGETVYQGIIPYQATFGAVAEGEPLVYLNSLNNVAMALNQGDFAGTYGIGSGGNWTIAIRTASSNHQ